MLKIWNIWKYSLGSFSDDKTAPFDNYVALIRTVIFISYMVTNTFIVSGVVRHWNEVSGHLPKTEEKGVCHTKGNVFQN